MDTPRGSTTLRQIIWADAVVKVRQGSRWTVVLPGRVIWAPARQVVWAVHGGTTLHRVSLSLETARQLPRRLTTCHATDVLQALLPLVARHPPGHPRRLLDEQVVVDEVLATLRKEAHPPLN